MSSPFYAALPVYLPFSGTVDANGNFSTILRPRSAFWVSGKIVPKLSLGSGVWEVTDGGSIPLGFGRGQRAEIGSIIVPPNASVVLNLSGAVPNAAVSGSFQGVQHPDMASLAARYAPIPNVSTVETTAVRRKLGNISTGPNTTSPASTFQLFAETRSIAIQAVTPGNLSNVNITGSQSGNVYYNTTPSGTLMEFVFIDFAVDTSILVTISAGVGGTSPSVTFWSDTADDFVKAWIQGSSNNQTVTVSGIPTVDVTDRAARLLGVINSITNAVDVSDRAARVLGIVQEGASPPLWQAPRAFTYQETNVNGTVIVPAVGGQTIRVWGIIMGIDGVGFGAVRDSSQVAPAGRLFSWNSSTGAGLTNTPGSVNHNGAPLNVGGGLTLDTSGGATVRCAVSYSQG